MSTHHPFRRKLIQSTKSSRPNFSREQDGYFLFFISRIATINNATIKITMNSSYVLISIILSIRLGSDESTSPTTWINILFLHTMFTFVLLPGLYVSNFVPRIVSFLLHRVLSIQNLYLIREQQVPLHKHR